MKKLIFVLFLFIGFTIYGQDNRPLSAIIKAGELNKTETVERVDTTKSIMFKTPQELYTTENLYNNSIKLKKSGRDFMITGGVLMTAGVVTNLIPLMSEYSLYSDYKECVTCYTIGSIVTFGGAVCMIIGIDKYTRGTIDLNIVKLSYSLNSLKITF